MVLEGLGEGEDEAMQLPVHMEYLIVYYISLYYIISLLYRAT